MSRRRRRCELSPGRWRIPLSQAAPALSVRSIEQIRRRRERIYATSKFTSPPRKRPNLRPAKGRALSPREVEVLSLLAESFEANEIAAALRISARTVKFHIGNALAKSGKHDRCSLVTWFSRNNSVTMLAPSIAPAGDEIELRSLMKDALARIEAEIAALGRAVRDRVARMERDLEGCGTCTNVQSGCWENRKGGTDLGGAASARRAGGP